jgi:hypothetical protein
MRSLRFTVVREYLIAYAPEEKPPVGCRGDARTAQPSRDGRNSQRQRVVSIVRSGPRSKVFRRRDEIEPFLDTDSLGVAP